MDLKVLFGQKLKKLRIERGLTQEALAEKVNLNPRQISKIETGEHLPSASTIEKFCEVLNILPQELFSFNTKNQSIRNRELQLIKQVQNLIKDEKYFNYINLAVNATKNKKALKALIHTLEGMELIM